MSGVDWIAAIGGAGCFGLAVWIFAMLRPSSWNGRSSSPKDQQEWAP